MRRIKFTTYGGSPVVGGFSPGTVATVTDDMARHLVKDARCAEYIDHPAVAAAEPPAGQAPAVPAAAKPQAKRAAVTKRTPAE